MGSIHALDVVDIAIGRPTMRCGSTRYTPGACREPHKRNEHLLMYSLRTDVIMTDSLIAEQELRFLLWNWLQVEVRTGADRDTVDAVLDLSHRLAVEAFLPHYKVADAREPSIDDTGQVHVLPDIGKAIRAYAEAGLFGAGFAEDLGGLGLPAVVTAAALAQFMAANLATSAYAMLTVGNARLIATFGSAAQIGAFARPQIAGEALGTMCLSEPQAGSGLGDIRTRATRDGEDALGQRFRLVGNKMWISGGDHDITRDITHLVLAKVPGADGRLPEGTAGISLFIVPKWLPDGERNDVAVAGLNHKMGYRGTANCLLNFGEGRETPGSAPGAVGWLVGGEGDGLTQMFQLMNEARINVGLGAAAVAYRGFRLAVAYARERVQGRALDAPRGASAPVAIIAHPDVQRMLLAQKAYAEGALALVLYCAALVDEEKGSDDAADLLALLTPVAKTWPSEWGVMANDLAIQVHGGYGYTRDFDVEQLYRDNRLNPIHEGTTGIQALDLLGRKVLRSDGRGLEILRHRVENTVRRARNTRHGNIADVLAEGWRRLDWTVERLRGAPVRQALSNATMFLRGFGHLVVGWMWLDQVLACDAATNADRAFLDGKRRACRYFVECELPQAAVWLDVAGSLTDVASGISAEEF